MALSPNRRRVLLAATVVGAAVTSFALQAPSAQAANSGRVGPYSYSSATGACTSASGVITGIAAPTARASMYAKWYGAKGPDGRKIGAQYVRATTTLSGLTGGSWKTIGAVHKGSPVAVNRTAKTLPAPAPFTGAAVPAGYAAYRLAQSVLWYSPRNPNSIDGTATRTLTAFRTAGRTLSACLPAPSAVTALTTAAQPTSFTLGFTAPATPYLSAVVVRYAQGTAAPTSVTAGQPVAVVGSTGSVTGLRPATTYSYTAWALDTAGQLSAPATGSVTTPKLAPVTAAGVTNAASVAAGGDETCVVDTAGALSCWGANAHGQLGDGTTTASTKAVAVTTGVSSVGVGDDFACALTTAATVECWGADDHGQLGDGGSTDRSTPAGIAGLSRVTQLSVGADHACALTTGALGTTHVYCWGDNGSGQLGDGTTTDRSTPVATESSLGLFEQWASVSAGATHTCATTSQHAVLCWGDNSSGELGTGTTTSTTTPVRLGGVTSDVVAAGDDTTCALASSGAVSCWGAGAAGQLGDGGSADSPTPVAVTGISTATALTSADGHTCAVLASGAAACWGHNEAGQLGDGTFEATSVPVNVLSVGGVSDVAGGAAHGCAVVTGATVTCWGSDGSGQLGDG